MNFSESEIIWLVAVLVSGGIGGLAVYLFLTFQTRSSTSQLRPKKLADKPKPTAKSLSNSQLDRLSKEVNDIAGLLKILDVTDASYAGLTRQLARIREAITERRSEPDPSASDLPQISRPRDYSEDVVPPISRSYSSYQPSEPEFVKITRLYNRAVRNRSEQDEFWRLYAAIKLGNANASEQHLGKTEVAVFKEAHNGDFIAVKLSGARHAVLLQFDVTLTPYAYEDGGVSTLFECPNYDRTRIYSKVEVSEPAIMEQSSNEWRLIKKGRLNL